MNYKISNRVALWIAIAVFALSLPGSMLLSGCKTSTTAIDTTRHFAPGLTIIFPNPPTPGEVNLLEDCRARKVSEKIFVIEAYDRRDENQGYALHQAYIEGATVKGWSP